MSVRTLCRSPTKYGTRLRSNIRMGRFWCDYAGVLGLFVVTVVCLPDSVVPHGLVRFSPRYKNVKLGLDFASPVADLVSWRYHVGAWILVLLQRLSSEGRFAYPRRLPERCYCKYCSEPCYCGYRCEKRLRCSGSDLLLDECLRSEYTK